MNVFKQSAASSYLPYPYSQASAQTVWNITHNLGYRPSVTVYDTESDTVVGKVVHASVNELTITFSVPIAGTAHLV